MGSLEQPKSLTWTAATTISGRQKRGKKKRKKRKRVNMEESFTMEAISSGKTWNLRATRCQPEIPGRLAPLENRLAAVRVVEAGRTQRNNKIESIIDFPLSSHRSWANISRYHRSHYSRDLWLSRNSPARKRVVCLKSDSGRCVSEETAGVIVEMSATAGLPSSSKQPDNYGETRVGSCLTLLQLDDIAAACFFDVLGFEDFSWTDGRLFVWGCLR